MDIGENAMNQFEYAELFKIGDKVWDRTAIYYNWDDYQGIIIDIDGSNVKVRYTPSGNQRWKKITNLIKITEEKVR
jgi:hypothetical protein